MNAMTGKMVNGEIRTATVLMRSGARVDQTRHRNDEGVAFSVVTYANEEGALYKRFDNGHAAWTFIQSIVDKLENGESIEWLFQE